MRRSYCKEDLTARALTKAPQQEPTLGAHTQGTFQCPCSAPIIGIGCMPHPALSCRIEHASPSCVRAQTPFARSQSSGSMIANNIGFYSSGDSAAEDNDATGSSENEWRTDVMVVRCYPCGRSDNVREAGIYFSSNNDTHVINNAGYISAEGIGYVELTWLKSPHAYMHHNYNSYVVDPFLQTQDLVRDAENHDFRPRAGTALVDAGFEIPGVSEGFIGSAPVFCKRPRTRLEPPHHPFHP